MINIANKLRKIALFGLGQAKKSSQVWESLDTDHKIWICQNSGACYDLERNKLYAKAPWIKLPTKIKEILTAYIEKRY
jgi:hypothetical protein